LVQDRRRCARDGTRAGVSISYGQALQAAIDGLVAMGIRPYIDDDLAAGRLVAHLH